MKKIVKSQILYRYVLQLSYKQINTIGDEYSNIPEEIALFRHYYITTNNNYKARKMQFSEPPKRRKNIFS